MFRLFRRRKTKDYTDITEDLPDPPCLETALAALSAAEHEQLETVRLRQRQVVASDAFAGAIMSAILDKES